MKRLTWIVVAAAALAACNKPSEGNCRKALMNMQRLMGTENLRDPELLEGEVRRCKGGSKKAAVECAIKAETFEELKHCNFYHLTDDVLPANLRSGSGGSGSTNGGSAAGSAATIGGSDTGSAAMGSDTTGSDTGSATTGSGAGSAAGSAAMGSGAGSAAMGSGAGSAKGAGAGSAAKGAGAGSAAKGAGAGSAAKGAGAGSAAK